MEAERKEALVEAAVAHDLTKRVIEEAVGNWTQNWDVLNQTILQALRTYARAAASKVLSSDDFRPAFGPSWKQEVANKACELVQLNEFVREQTPIVVDALRAEFGDTSRQFDGLWGYSLAKVANSVGSVAIMLGCDLDPSLLLLTSEEANESLLKLADRLQEVAPDKVMKVFPGADIQDVVDEIKKKARPSQ